MYRISQNFANSGKTFLFSEISGLKIGLELGLKSSQFRGLDLNCQSEFLAGLGLGLKFVSSGLCNSLRVPNSVYDKFKFTTFTSLIRRTRLAISKRKRMPLWNLDRVATRPILRTDQYRF